MRVFFLTLSLLLTAILFSQSIPNSSFENWSVASQGHEDPDFWNTANPTTNVFPVNTITTEKTDDSYDGNYAVKLSSKTILTFVAPGFITLGDVDIDLFTQQTDITGGIDYSLRPSRLKLYYKYSPAVNDNFRIGLWLLRNDGTPIPDTVATALFESTEAKTEYTELTVNLEYRNDFSPEVLNIIAVSSNPDNPIAGSLLIIDKIELEYETGILSKIVNSNLFYPNPAEDVIFINDYFKGYALSISDNMGREIVKLEKIDLNYLDISMLKSGAYNLIFMKAGLQHSQKLIKL